MLRSYAYLKRLLRRPSLLDSRHWDREYAAGCWDFLDGMDEMARFWVAAGYCHARCQNPSVLDVGCGAGLLESRLRKVGYSAYLGMDLSQVALRKARQQMPDRCRLVCADLLTFYVRETFDVIIFSESLVPGPPVLPILRRFEPFLCPNGCFIVSVFEGRDRRATLPVWEQFAEAYRIVDCTRIEHLPSGKSWRVGLLEPARKDSA